MNKSDLLIKLKTKEGAFSEEDIESSINLILYFISRTLEEANRVEIRNFGTFSARKREKRLSRNPKTGEKVNTPKKKTIHFKMSKEMFNKLNNGK